MEEDTTSSVRELLGLVVTLVFSNLRRLAPEHDLRHIVEPTPIESHHLLRDELRPHVDTLVGRYVKAPASSEEGGLDVGSVNAMDDVSSPSP